MSSNGFDDDAVMKTDWKQNLIDCLLQIDPSAFERLAQKPLREAGFVKVEVREKSGDGGINGVGVLRADLGSFQVYFQCKRWKEVSSLEKLGIFAVHFKAELTKVFS